LLKREGKEAGSSGSKVFVEGQKSVTIDDFDNRTMHCVDNFVGGLLL
jgi:hypothetical protein